MPSRRTSDSSTRVKGFQSMWLVAFLISLSICMDHSYAQPPNCKPWHIPGPVTEACRADCKQRQCLGAQGNNCVPCRVTPAGADVLAEVCREPVPDEVVESICNLTRRVVPTDVEYCADRCFLPCEYLARSGLDSCSIAEMAATYPLTYGCQCVVNAAEILQP